MCDRLVRKGLVTRRRASADRRTVRVSLAPAGRELVAEVDAQAAGGAGNDPRPDAPRGPPSRAQSTAGVRRRGGRVARTGVVARLAPCRGSTRGEAGPRLKASGSQSSPDKLRRARTLAATGASPRTRRSLTAVTALALGLLGAILGVAAAYVSVVGYMRSNPLLGLPSLEHVPLRYLLVLLLGMPAMASVVDWLHRGTSREHRRDNRLCETGRDVGILQSCRPSSIWCRRHSEGA